MITPKENDPSVLADIEEFKKKLPCPCGLCGQIGSDGIAGVYKPPTKDLGRWGAVPKGKDKYFIYRLCPLCAKKPDYPRQIEKKLYESGFDRGNLNLDAALDAYSNGKPVVVYAKGYDDHLPIHGRETLQAITQLGTTLEATVIRGVPIDDWNNSEWPEVLEAARRVFMEQGGFELRR